MISRQGKMKKGRKPKIGNITQKGVSVLTLFSEDYSARFSASEISRITGLPQQTVSHQLNALAGMNLISFAREGKNKLFFIDPSQEAARTLFDLIEAHKALRFQLESGPAAVIVNEISRHCESVIVFGSYASGGFDEESDLDIVVLGGCDKDAVRKVKRASAIEVNEHYAEYGEFERILAAGNPLAREIMENHVVCGDISKVVRIFWRRAYERR
jgi:predicted nucleotidyltransferase